MTANSQYDLEGLGRTLRRTLAALIESFPPEARSNAGMARWLGINKSTCQRLVEGVRQATDGRDVLVRLPGKRGLELVLEAAEARGAPESRLASARLSVTTFISAIQHYGSQRKLADAAAAGRTNAMRSAPPSDADRRRFFRAAVAVMQHQVDVMACVAAVCPRPRSRGCIDRMVSAMQGIRGLDRVMVAIDHTAIIGASSAEERPQLLPAFSSPGIGGATTLRDDGGHRGLFDDLGAEVRPYDVATHHPRVITKQDPTRHPPYAVGVRQRVNVPAKLLTIDLLVHERWARIGTPLARLYSPAQLQEQVRPSLRTVGLLPGPPVAQALGPAAHANRAGSGFRRAQELADLTTDAWQLDLADYFAYRVEVPWPVFSARYELVIEFGEDTGTANS